MNRRMVETGDGSHSLYVDELKEHYHSWNGALEESRYVFIKMGLNVLQERFPATEPLRILEIGLGTGLNALVTLQAADRPIWYTGVEAYPVTTEEAALLNYPELSGEPGAREAFTDLHAAPWDEWHTWRPDFHIYKLQGLIESFTLSEPVHLIYFDAFAPNKQPDMWTDEVFARMYDMLLPGGRLTTYCAKGSVRRSMQSLGLEIGRPPGPPGKREMLVGDKS